MINKFCNSVDAYLAEHPSNVVGIHCKAGKGRTGLMVSCYLLHSGLCLSADAALGKFSRERTWDNKGVTIPSQIRYAYYYEALLRRPQVTSYSYKLTRVRFNSVPNFDASISGGGCDPYLVVKALIKAPGDNVVWNRVTVFNQLVAVGARGIKKFYPRDGAVDLDMSALDVFLNGDVNLIFFDYDTYSQSDKMFELSFHTAFVENNYLAFEKGMLDGAIKDKKNLKFSVSFKVELFMERVPHKEMADYVLERGPSLDPSYVSPSAGLTTTDSAAAGGAEEEEEDDD
jgi:phosphatidylinositol-3,4,5-trisphosphate 3-phosphatase/dual-specificity protein phosphatase PTEN